VWVKDDQAKVHVWGRNEHGQLGVGNRDDKKKPVELAGVTGLLQMSTGSGFTFAVCRGPRKPPLNPRVILRQQNSGTVLSIDEVNGGKLAEAVAMNAEHSQSCSQISCRTSSRQQSNRSKGSRASRKKKAGVSNSNSALLSRSSRGRAAPSQPSAGSSVQTSSKQYSYSNLQDGIRKLAGKQTKAGQGSGTQ